METRYYGHTREESATGKQLPKEEWQLLKDHLEAVAQNTEKFANRFGAAKLGYIAGIFHDAGKYSNEFQRRLEGYPGRVDHATAGAKEAFAKYSPHIGNLLAYIIAGHHGGLPDGTRGDISNLPERLERDGLPDYKEFSREMDFPTLSHKDLMMLPLPRISEMTAFSLQFLVRMLYSCLVDADFLDTEHFMNPEKSEFRVTCPCMATLEERFEQTLEVLGQRGRNNPSPINTARAEILQQSLQAADLPAGFFSLSVPTGGGKTYSSLAMAIKHALKNGMDRVIYVIPYTSIIEQNAQVFREALGDDAVLEHHSHFEYPEGLFDNWNEHEKTHRLASENWDKPLVATTAVQFFESLYANKGSRCRKLHNMTNSVIILDEAQMMPLEYLKPCLWALTELVFNYHATVIFCTATQPAVKPFLPGKPGKIIVTEIMKDPESLQRLFKRVKTVYRGKMSDEEVADEMAHTPQVLTVVNTRRHARILYDVLEKKEPTGLFHLSARMCPAHRKDILKQIRNALSSKGIEPCRVVSTQLIEAGVDVDFPAVFRSVAGLDSIAQAAGRCNREGRMSEQGIVTVFEPEKHGMPKCFETVVGITRGIIRRLDEYGNDLLSLDAIHQYFIELYNLDPALLDQKQILETIRNGVDPSVCIPGKLWMTVPFASIAQEFHLIDNMTVALVVSYNCDAMRIMEEAEGSYYPAKFARQLQPYVVHIYRFELDAMKKENLIKAVGEFMWFLSNPDFYDASFGLKDAKEVKQPDSSVYIL